MWWSMTTAALASPPLLQHFSHPSSSPPLPLSLVWLLFATPGQPTFPLPYLHSPPGGDFTGPPQPTHLPTTTPCAYDISQQPPTNYIMPSARMIELVEAV